MVDIVNRLLKMKKKSIVINIGSLLSNRNLNPSIAVFEASAEPNLETIKVIIKSASLTPYEILIIYFFIFPI